MRSDPLTPQITTAMHAPTRSGPAHQRWTEPSADRVHCPPIASTLSLRALA
jgi:hypothetical protein